MIHRMIYGMVYLGSLLMVYDIYCFVRFIRFIENQAAQEEKSSVLYAPVVLLVFFLFGYLAVGIFGHPDLVMAGIMLGGSIFVFIMYRLLHRITQQIIENHRLEAKLMAAEESSKVKSDILSNLSHEMRTPMNVILGLDAIALKNPDLPPQTREQLEKIGQSGRHLLQLINNTLDMQYLESGDLTVKQEFFSLQDVMDQIDAVVHTNCEEKGLIYQSSIHSGAACRYIGDEMMLKQVLLCLLDNAVKYTDAPGTVSLSADRISTGEDTCRLQFSVTDTGIGMSADFLPKAFDLFARENSSPSSGYGGSGLGLTIARNKVRLMGGDIVIVSEPNSGSVFIVTVPFRTAEEVQISEESEAEPVRLADCRILVVDDIEENAEIVSDLLELEGAVSEHAENGQIALEMFSRSAPSYYDAVLMDLRMPVMDGLEAASTIRKLDRPDAKNIPIIALTANAFESDMRQSKAAGLNAHLMKPIDVDLLYATLTQYIWKSRVSERGPRSHPDEVSAGTSALSPDGPPSWHPDVKGGTAL